MPTNYDQKRRIGWVRTDTSSNIIQFTFLNGAYVWEEKIATTSGTIHTILNIVPDTKRVLLTGTGVSLSGTDELLLQIGDSGGVETSGYSGGCSTGGSNVDNSAGFFLSVASAATDVVDFVAQLELIDATGIIWTHSGVYHAGAAQRGGSSVGQKTLSAELDRIVLDTNGTDTFDAGTVQYQFDGYPDPRALP
jgi:hypothetical protein